MNPPRHHPRAVSREKEAEQCIEGTRTSRRHGRVLSSIPPAAAVSVVNAVLFALQQGIRFQLAPTVTWRRVPGLGLVADQEIAKAHVAFLNRVSEYCRRHGGQLTYVWTAERKSGRGLHYHYLFAVPPELVDEIRRRLPGWLSPSARLPAKTVVTKRSNGHKGNLGWLRYILKGIDTQNPMDLTAQMLFIVPESQGVIRGKHRTGVSRNIGPAARDAGGWNDLPASIAGDSLDMVRHGYPLPRYLTRQEAQAITDELIRRGLWSPGPRHGHGKS